MVQFLTLPGRSINDPLGQLTVVDFEKYKRTDDMCEYSYHHRPCLWIDRVDQQDRSHQWSTRPDDALAGSEDLVWLGWFWKWGRTYGRSDDMGENSELVIITSCDCGPSRGSIFV